MAFEWDEPKRQATLVQRGLDFRDAVHVFDGRPLYTYASPRADEVRWVSVGLLEGRSVAIVWTRRQESIRIISMRRARDAEERHYRALFG